MEYKLIKLLNKPHNYLSIKEKINDKNICIDSILNKFIKNKFVFQENKNFLSLMINNYTYLNNLIYAYQLTKIK